MTSKSTGSAFSFTCFVLKNFYNLAPMTVHQHFALHKPLGYISQFVYTHKRKKGLLGSLYDFPDSTMAIGRLDVHSEGLLLLTTDGKVSEAVRSKHVEKEYYVQVDGLIDEVAMRQLMAGVSIGIKGQKYVTNPCKAHILNPAPSFPARSKKIRDDRHGPTSWISITLTEGKNRQVRKMTAAVGYPTLRLIRVRIGNIQLDGLKAGEVRELKNLDKAIKSNKDH